MVFNGLIDWPEPWIKFFKGWNELLHRNGLADFHAVEALRFSQPYGNMKRCNTPEERATDLLPFVREIVKGVQVGIVAAVDVAAYKSAHQALHKRFGADPHIFAFYVALSEALRCFTVPPNLTIGLILDDDESKSKLCYDLWRKLKMLDKQVRERIPSICFGSDKSDPPLQGTDLFASLSRLESERKFLNKGHRWASLWDEMTVKKTPDRRLQFRGGFYGKKEINEYVINQILPLNQRLTW